MRTAETNLDAPRDVEDLEERLSQPTSELVADLAAVDGHIMLLGVGGKMGPTLARMARRAAPERRRPRPRAAVPPRPPLQPPGGRAGTRGPRSRADPRRLARPHCDRESAARP